MGGTGSGRSRGWRGHTVGDYESLDIRQLRKAGYIGCVGTWVQWRTGRQYLEFVEGAVIATFGGRHGSTHHIILETTPCNLGGVRTWFCCPRCGGRTVELHLSGEKLTCRHCHKLTYDSQRERDADRAMRRQRKIRARLGMGPNLVIPITVKPKWMHWSAFERLRARDSGSAAVSIASLCRLMERMRAAQVIDLGESVRKSRSA